MRSIACGIVYRWLAPRLGMQCIKDKEDLHDYFEPRQVSVGTAGGLDPVFTLSGMLCNH